MNSSSYIWDKVFKSGPSKICGRQTFKNFTWSTLEYLNSYNTILLKPKNILPIALDKFKPPFMRPSPVILPPALSIRVFSGSSSGLWSTDISIGNPFRHKTQRESPAFATYNLFLYMRATIAVVPLSFPTSRKKIQQFEISYSRYYFLILNTFQQKFSLTKRKIKNFLKLWLQSPS